jgi:hypothetical protein
MVMSIPEGEEMPTNGIENILNKIIAEIFPNHGKEMDIGVQKFFRIPKR